MKQARPRRRLQRVENRVARITEAAGEFERPDAFLVHDGIEVDIAAIAALAQQRYHPSQCEVMEAPGPLIGDDGAHLAGEFAEVAGEETLVLEVEAGRLQE